MRLQRDILKTIIESKNPTFFTRLPPAVSGLLLRTLERIVHLDELCDFFDTHGDARNWDFIEAVFEYLDYGYTVSDSDLAHIPAEGRLICVSNHPQGPLDGLILLHLIGRVRRDVKIFLTDLLAQLENLSDLFLPFDQYSAGLQRQNLLAIRHTLFAEHALIFFPAAHVTKFGWRGLRDGRWHNGPVSCARKYNAPILPVAIKASNSPLYYALSLFNKHLSTLLLTHEMFAKRGARIPVNVGTLLPYGRFAHSGDNVSVQSQALRGHVRAMLRA